MSLIINSRRQPFVFNFAVSGRVTANTCSSSDIHNALSELKFSHRASHFVAIDDSPICIISADPVEKSSKLFANGSSRDVIKDAPAGFPRPQETLSHVIQGLIEYM